MNLDEARKFLNALDPSGVHTFQTFNDCKALLSPNNLTTVLHGTIDEHFDTLCRLNKQGAGIFVSVNETDGKGRKLSNIKRVRAVYMEDDHDTDPASLPIKPNITVESSPGHYHRYWLLDTEAAPKPEEFLGVMNRVVESYGSDKGAKDLTRVLRVPGFYHKKDPKAPHEVRLVELSETDKKYSWGQIAKAFPPIIQVEKGPKPSEDDTDLEEIRVLHTMFTSKNGNKAKALWEGDLSEHEGDHSAADMALCAHLAYWLDNDPEGVDRYFRMSGLMRPKWDERRNGGTYGSTTIAKVLKAAPEEDPEDLFLFLTEEELQKTPDTSWVVRGVLPSDGLAAVWGPSTIGKSFLVLDLAAHVALGRPWFGKTTKPTPVFYFALEGQAGFKKRTAAWAAHNRTKFPSTVYFCGAGLDLRDKSTVAKISKSILRKSKGQRCIVVFDTLNRAAPGLDENSSKDYGAIMSSANAIQEAVGGLILLVAHPGKDPERGIRGHSSLYAGLDASIAVLRDKKTQGLFWRVDKAKDGEMGSDFWFERTTISLGIDDENETITSQAIEPLDKVEVRDNELSQNEQRVFDALCVAWMFSEVPDGLREDELQAGLPTPVQSKNWTDLAVQWGVCSSAQFKRVKQTLVSRGYVSREERGVREVFFIPQV